MQERNRRPATVILAVILVLGVALRTVVAAQGWFYWDDLTLHAQARAHDAPTLGLLLTDHDGHLMPGAWLIEWLVATYFPLDWPAAVAVLGLLQLVAAAAVARACLVLCPRVSPVRVRGRELALPWAAVPLACYLLSPLTLPSTTWLATAVNILPLHAAMALTIAHSVLAVRHRSIPHLVIAAAALLGGLLFSERALFTGPITVVLLVCCVVAAGQWRVHRSGIARVAVALAVPTIAWAGIYLAVIGDPRAGEQLTATATVDGGGGGGVSELVFHGYLYALLPTVAGGPWRWDRWHPGPPWADPPTAVIIAGLVVGAVVLGWTARGRIRHLWAWLPVVAYPLVPIVALTLVRTGPETAAEITQTLRHFSEVTVLAVVVCAFLLARPERRPLPPAGRLFAAGVAGLLVVSVVVSTVAYARVWADQPARDYFRTLRVDLAQREEPIFDQAVDLHVLLPVVHPHNLLSRLIGGLEGVPPIDSWTTAPALVDGEGHLRPAELVPLRATDPGAEPDCGVRVGAQGQSIDVDGPLLERDWVLQFNYFADRAGTVELALDGDPVTIPVEAGLSQVYVSLPGGGDQLRVTPGEGVSELCVGRNQLGVLAVSR